MPDSIVNKLPLINSMPINHHKLHLFCRSVATHKNLYCFKSLFKASANLMALALVKPTLMLVNLPDDRPVSVIVYQYLDSMKAVI